MNAIDARPTCPRCEKPGTRNHDEWMCFDHGTFVVVPRPGDPTGYDRADAEATKTPGKPRVTYAPPSHQFVPWTEKQLHDWESWQEGDPLPAWAENTEEDDMTAPTPQPAPGGRDELSAPELVRLTKNRVETLAATARTAIAALNKCQEEAATIAGFIKAMGEDFELPDELQGVKRAGRVQRAWTKKPPQQCDECDFVGVNLGSHKANKHGGSTS